MQILRLKFALVQHRQLTGNNSAWKLLTTYDKTITEIFVIAGLQNKEIVRLRNNYNLFSLHDSPPPSLFRFFQHSW